jgi:peptidoglycan hydrolase-like protein with peptidoglycan-binding domain
MTLKLGSKGEAVKTLQEFLKIFVDGNFGPKTEAAVKTYQLKMGLIVDGVVGPKTWAVMGILNTDNAENEETQAALEIIKHYMPENTYFKGPVKKQWIFLHHTAGWENPYIV